MRNLKKAVIITLTIMILSTGVMAVIQLIQGSFEWKATVIAAISQLIVGVPFFYFIAKWRTKKKQDNDKISI